MKFMLYDQKQSLLLPPTLSECLPEDHISFMIDDMVNNLDLSEVEKGYVEEGHPAYNPKIMIKVLFYGYLQGVRSSRKLENKTYEDIAFRYLTANARLDHGTINLFRKNHLQELPLIFAQIIAAAKGLGLADFADISVDGTKIKAQASRSNLFTKEEIAKLKTKIEAFLSEAEKIDDEEDKKFGDNRGYNQLPKRLADPKTRREEIRKFQKRLAKLDKANKEIDQKQEKAKDKDKNRCDRRSEKESNKTNNLTSNTTDNEASIMKLKDGSYKMAYNVGIAAASQFITAYDVTSDSADTETLPEMVKITEANTKEKVKKTKADSAYFTKDNLAFLESNQTEAFIPDTLMRIEERKEEKDQKKNASHKYNRIKFTYDKEKDQFTCPDGKLMTLVQKNKHGFKTGDGIKIYKGQECESCPHLKLCAKGKARYFTVDFELEKIKKTMREKLNTPEGKEKYGQRLHEIEPVMADLKYNQGFDEFLCKGKTMALVELGLASSVHNLKKIFFALQRKNIKPKEINWNSLMKTQTI